jgi:hypothetical protein
LLNPRLTAILEATRAAIVSSSTTHTEQLEAPPVAKRNVTKRHSIPAFGIPRSLEEALEQQQRVTVRLPQSGPRVAELETLADLEALKPRRGKGAGTEGQAGLLKLLHGLAVHVLHQRGHKFTPDQVTYHTSQELIAAALGVDEATVWRWTQHLKDLGVIDSRPHYTQSNGQTRVSGTLYAVSMKAGYRAKLKYADLSHKWRNLDADRAAGNTAWSALKNMQGSDPKAKRSSCVYILKLWAVTPGQTKNPLSIDPCNNTPEGPTTVRDVIYSLSLVAEADESKRAALVGLLASGLAHALNDQHSRLYWCKVIWEAYRATLEGRGGLQTLAAQLNRLEVDRREWTELRRPAALLTSRLSKN